MSELLPPAPDLVACVVIPAHNEQRRIAACLRALAAQREVDGSFEVLLVADGCTDRTLELAIATADEDGLALLPIVHPPSGAGVARRAGMELAAARLHAVGRPHGLIACTDADTRVASDWLATQLALAGAGAHAIGGLVELDALEAAELEPAVLRRRELHASRRLEDVRALDPTAEHHHFAGASLGVTAATYVAVGGLEPLSSLEDEAFARRLQRYGIPITRSTRVRVTTSARTRGRSRRGLSADLDLATWMARRRYDAGDFDLRELRIAKGSTEVAVILPTKSVAGSLPGVLRETVAPLLRAGLIDDVVVIDANSPDGTAAAARDATVPGVRVLQENDVLREFGPALGKGDAMWRALHATSAEIVCFLDADTLDPSPAHLLGLLGPLLSDPQVALVKGAFARPMGTAAGELPDEGGRVTELMARPLLNLHEPRLAVFAQPLAGETAARRSLLERLRFPVGYGVEVAMMLDALELVGLDGLAECWLGTRRNRHQPLRALGEMAYAVLAAVERRKTTREVADGQFMRPWDDHSIARVPIAERPALITLAHAVSVNGHSQDAEHDALASRG
jgi:glucosyl-3-phosphoglycerate synthase